MEARQVTKRAKPIAPTNPFLEFDLSHIPLKDEHAELPLWVGDLREEYYKKSNGGDKRTDDFEYVS